MDNDVLMTIDRDGRYSSCITVDGKSYVLQDYDGSLTIKGATLSGRSLEKYNRQFVKEAINAILDGNIDRVRSEERRVGKESKDRRATPREKDEQRKTPCG